MAATLFFSFLYRSHDFTARISCLITLGRKNQSQWFWKDVRVSVTSWAVLGRCASILLKIQKRGKGGVLEEPTLYLKCLLEKSSSKEDLSSPLTACFL